MKYVITESQHKRLFEEEQKILHIPDIKIFGDWDGLQRFLESKGNPLYSISGNLRLRNTPIESLGNLTYVGGNLNLINTPIKSLGNLQSVGGDLFLEDTPIESIGNLQSVGGNLDIFSTPISKKYSEEEIRQMVNVGGNIYL
jgi:muramoyltetrapeptide carboxypeptidase LdcA involved in peptidoglycan recycling